MQSEISQGALANTYHELGRLEEALSLQRDVYSGRVKLMGVEHRSTLIAANNYAMTLLQLKRFKEAERVLRKVAPAAQRVLGNEHELTLSIREDLCRATLDGDSSAEEKREALQMLEDTVAVMRRVLGPTHPDTLHAQSELKIYRRKNKNRAHGVR